jgi:hypothetical protein
MEADDPLDGPTEPNASAPPHLGETEADDDVACMIEEAVERGVRRALGSRPHDAAVPSADRKEVACRDDGTKKRGSSDPRGTNEKGTTGSRSSRRKPLARKIEELTATIETRLMQSK